MSFMIRPCPASEVVDLHGKRSQELAHLRAARIHTRRSYTRSWWRQHGDGEEDQLYEEVRITLKLAISCAKDTKRKEMLENLDRDPWGHLHRTVRRKLMETLQRSFLQKMVEGLFPQQAEHTPLSMAYSVTDDGGRE